MRDLRIVIVPWNSEQQLAACLSSLPAACEGLTWEVVVVDNASSDKSVEVARAHIGGHGYVITNKDNRGFAKACNQGISGSDTRYILLLNPDTVCPKGSLTQLVRTAEAHPEAGIIGPKLVNVDGTAQTSIRRFPGVWDQAGIMLKLHNFVPGWFTRYFAADWPLDEGREVDTVMGACFLIRRELLKDIGALDERYFVWFEEVDYCRTAREKGWKVCYVPNVSVTHVGGQSFDQVFSLKKQSYFNVSLISYFRKWYPGWPAMLLQALHPVSLALAWVASRIGVAGRGSKTILSRTSLPVIPADAAPTTSIRKILKRWIAVLLALTAVSAATFFHPAADMIACILAGVIMFAVSARRPTLGLAVIALELMIGSQGHLLQIGKGFIALRSMLFVAFFLAWGISFIRRGSLKGIWKLFHGREEWLVLGAFIVYAFLRGITLGNAPIIADTNGWVFVAMILPVLDLATREGERLLRDMIPVFIIAPLWLAAEALGVEYLYAHGLAIVNPPSLVHLWIRGTYLAEVTPLGRSAYRVFLTSFIFVIPPFLFWLSKRFTTQDKALKNGRATLTVGDLWAFAAVVTFVLGLSRSMWIGTIAAVAVLAALHLWKGRTTSVAPMAEALVRFAFIVILAIAVVDIAKIIPLPPVAGDVTGSVASRITTSDPASDSRRALLTALMAKINEHPILGSGFGATVTYQSADPRVLAEHPDGMYTTYTFEWGWLDHWVKFGLFGFFLMIFLVCRLGWRIWETPSEYWIKYAMLGSLVAITVTHVFTPYLNVPLGFGYLMMLEGWTIIAASTPALRPLAASTE